MSAPRGTNKPKNTPRPPARATRRSKPKITESFAAIEPKKIKWLWWPWIPLGKLTILEGEPDVGKSTMTLEWCAFITTGVEFPATTISGDPGRLPGHRPSPCSVLLVGIEDDAADTIVPRMDANGTDRAKVHRMQIQRDDDGLPIPWIIPDDVSALRAAIRETKAKMVVIDPITAFLSDKIKSGSDTSNRKALGYLAEVAAETGAAIILIRHLNKAAGMDAKSRGGGSIAFTALARSVIVAGKLPADPESDDDGPRFVLASTKGNLGPAPDSFRYSLDASPANPDVAVVGWHGSIEMSADQLVGADRAAPPDSRKRAPDREEATRVLVEILADGPMPSKDAIDQVRQETGVSEKTVHAARIAAGVETKRMRNEDGRTSSWEWSLPARFRP